MCQGTSDAWEDDTWGTRPGAGAARRQATPVTGSIIPYPLVRFPRSAAPRCLAPRPAHDPSALVYAFPPTTTRRRLATGMSGGLRGRRSENCAPHPVPRGSSRHGQSLESRTIRSSRRISDPYLVASRANRYAPLRLHSSHRSRTSTYGKSARRRTLHSSTDENGTGTYPEGRLSQSFRSDSKNRLGTVT
jgi:hypothetical protein